MSDLAEPATAAFELWGGIATVCVTEADALPAALAAVHPVLDEFDRACSSFRTDSELAAVNRGAGGAVAVGPVLLDAVAAALRAAALTDGDVDPTVGQALIAHGIHGASADDGGPVRIEAVPGIQTVTLDRGAGTVGVARGVHLDLGATAKALAADRAAAAASAVAGCGVLVNLLGDLAIAGPAPAAGWSVRVTDDHRCGIEARGQSVALGGGGLATSSVTVRGNGNAHHLIDPRTGAPVDAHFRTASVTAATCLDANIAATAAIIRGYRAIDWLADHGLAARLVRADGAVAHLAGWPAAGDDLPTIEVVDNAARRPRPTAGTTA